MKFVKLHSDYDALLFVNPEAVGSISKRDVKSGGSVLALMHSIRSYVTEEPEEVVRLLEEASSKE